MLFCAPLKVHHPVLPQVQPQLLRARVQIPSKMYALEAHICEGAVIESVEGRLLLLWMLLDNMETVGAGTPHNRAGVAAYQLPSQVDRPGNVTACSY